MAPTGPFPRRANLPDPCAPCPDKKLAAKTRTVDHLSDADYWARVCPGLHVGGKLQGVKPLKAPEAFAADIQSQINSEGVCQVIATATLSFWVKMRQDGCCAQLSPTALGSPDSRVTMAQIVVTELAADRHCSWIDLARGRPLIVKGEGTPPDGVPCLLWCCACAAHAAPGLTPPWPARSEAARK